MCDIPYCRKKDLEVIYYGKDLCKRCFLKYSSIELKQILEINTDHAIHSQINNKKRVAIGSAAEGLLIPLTVPKIFNQIQRLNYFIVKTYAPFGVDVYKRVCINT